MKLIIASDIHGSAYWCGKLMELIDREQPDKLILLGDLLYQVVFHSAIAEEAGWFSLGDVADAIHDKLVRRHGHVFDPARSDAATPTVDELVTDWEHDKRAELGRDSVFDGIPASLPALARALKVVRKTEAIGATSRPSTDAADAAVALGEQLFALVEAAQRAGVDPEDALRRATDRRMAQVRQHEVGGSGT